MFEIDFQAPCHVYMIGIGGISMSGLAEILMRDGFRMSGSDRSPSVLTEKLAQEGARVFYGQRTENISDDIDCVVYTAAIRPGNPEYDECVRRGIPMLTRAQLLGQIMKKYGHSIAVSGTHGKTTTTSMVTHILLAAGEDPTVSVGGMLPIIGGNIRIGSDEMFVTEACEYTNSFLDFNPTIEVILNVEADHLDFFKDIDDIRSSFRAFTRRLPDDGTVVISDRIRDWQEITKDFPGEIITFGGPGAHVSAENISYNDAAAAAFDLLVDGRRVDRIQLAVPGEHNVFNACAAIAVALKLGIEEKTFKRGLETFTGAERRFEKKGMLGEITVIDDYAHHPQEIEATLKAAQHYPHKRVVCVFQPHTYTRTKALLKEFAQALQLADTVVLADIYPARETDTLGVSSRDIAELIRQAGGDAHYIPTFDEIETWLLENLDAGDLCITMGAGDIVKVGERLLGK